MEINKKQIILICIVAVSLIVSAVNVCWAKEKTRLHPRNKKLVKLGLLKYPMFYQHMPRITAREAMALYKKYKALFVLIASKDLHLIEGGIHLTEGQVQKINPNRLPLKNGQVLVMY